PTLFVKHFKTTKVDQSAVSIRCGRCRERISTLQRHSSVYHRTTISKVVGNRVVLHCDTEPNNKLTQLTWKMNGVNLFSFSPRKPLHTSDKAYNLSINMSLNNSESPQYALIIERVQTSHSGNYTCEKTSNDGPYSKHWELIITVPPTISAWLERKDNMVVAVCKAERGKPAASITWSHMENLTAGEPVIDSKGFFTVESRLEFLEGMNPENLSCVIRHPYWREEQIFVPKHRKGEEWIVNSAVLCVLLHTVMFCFVTPLCFFQTEDVEEVEPYASYVQRVNSIYNSSADLN
uniref:Ig-like domain-containing protein n=1 Tax=Dicentrarchus labrax TaxID=13489 RepID=A0A8C4IPK2_DICLA